MNYANRTSFIGIGWAFPPTFSAEGDTVAMVSGTEDIEQSLTILMQTAIGQRPFQPDYHCDLQAYVFQQSNVQLVENIKQTLQKSIAVNEPRIELEQVDVQTHPEQPEQLLISLFYRIRQTNTRHNKTYPFCIAEGTNFLLATGDTSTNPLELAPSKPRGDI